MIQTEYSRNASCSAVRCQSSTDSSFSLLTRLARSLTYRSSASSKSRRVSQLHCLATHSVEDPRPAEGFPAAVRHLLVHQEHRATNLRRRATRRCDKRSGELTPLDCPATIQKSQVLVFRDVAQHLELFVSRLAFIALSDSLLADFCRRDWPETHGVIGPQIRQRNRISR